MDLLRQHEISEADHRILNPFTDDKLMLLGEVCRLEAGHRQLDLASGKGEMLCRWAERWGIGGLGVDISAVFVPAARARAEELGVADRVRFEQGDAAEALDGQEGYDVVSCIGATWIGDGLLGTVGLMRPAVRDDGLLLIGESYWKPGTPDEAYGAFGRDAFTTLVGTLDRFESVGLELVEMVLADDASWDRYVASQWWTVERWLADNPQDPDAADMRQFLVDSRRTHLEYQRDYLGWGVFVLRV